MFGRIVLAVVIFVLVGLLLTDLVGPGLVNIRVVTVGDFFISFGWILGVLAGLWFFFAGSTTVNWFRTRTR